MVWFAKANNWKNDWKLKVCDSVLSYFDRNGSYVSTRRIADQCGRNIIAQKAPVIRENEILNEFRTISNFNNLQYIASPG